MNFAHTLIDIDSSQVQNILKYLFPVAKQDSARVITFANDNDYISFRCVCLRQPTLT